MTDHFTSILQRLFDYVAQEYGNTLMESELYDLYLTAVGDLPDKLSNESAKSAAKSAAKSEVIKRLLKALDDADGELEMHNYNPEGFIRSGINSAVRLAKSVEDPLQYSEFDKLKMERDQMKTILQDLSARMQGHGWGSCSYFAISQAPLYLSDLENINRALGVKQENNHG